MAIKATPCPVCEVASPKSDSLTLGAAMIAGAGLSLAPKSLAIAFVSTTTTGLEMTAVASTGLVETNLNAQYAALNPTAVHTKSVKRRKAQLFEPFEL